MNEKVLCASTTKAIQYGNHLLERTNHIYINIYYTCKMAGFSSPTTATTPSTKKITFNLTLFMVNEHIPLSIYSLFFLALFNFTSSIFVCKLKVYFTMYMLCSRIYISMFIEC